MAEPWLTEGLKKTQQKQSARQVKGKKKGIYSGQGKEKTPGVGPLGALLEADAGEILILL